MHEARALEAAFERIEVERMQDIPILNRNLSVEAVGFSEWAGHPLGVLITSWFMNLVWISESIPEGGRLNLPCGEIDFLPFLEPETGRFHCCSLFSPMSGFRDQDHARETALAALDLIFRKETLSRRDFLRGKPWRSC